MITLDTLIELRDCMTVEQLERYGYYFEGRIPPVLFTEDEIVQLQLLKRIRQTYQLSDFLQKNTNSANEVTSSSR